MGLCIGNKLWSVSFSYGWFHEFRKQIAEKLWFWDLDLYVWFDGYIGFPSRRAFPIVSFLSHSDCDWTLKPNKETVQSLKSIKLDDDFNQWRLEQLVLLMDESIKNKKLLKFT